MDPRTRHRRLARRRACATASSSTCCRGRSRERRERRAASASRRWPTARAPAGRLALDTEFMGEGRYRTLLCLIQLAIPEQPRRGERIALVDPLEEDLDGSAARGGARRPGGADRRARRAPGHRADAPALRLARSRNVFDTQVAAGFAGLGAQSSYDSLLAEILGLRVAKTASFTRWDARPLSAEQLAYAREDVVHLLELGGRARAAPGRARAPRVGARGVRAAGTRSSDERDPRDDLRAAAPRRRPERVARGRSRASWSSGASARPRARTGRCRACSATRRWSRSPGGGPPRASELERIRGVGAALAAGAARSCSRRSRAARERPPEPPPQSAAPAAAEARRRAAGRPRRGAPARARARGRPRLRAAGRARRPAGDRRRRRAPAPRRPDVRTLRGWRRELVGAELLELLDGAHLAVGRRRRSAQARARADQARGLLTARPALTVPGGQIAARHNILAPPGERAPSRRRHAPAVVPYSEDRQPRKTSQVHQPKGKSHASPQPPGPLRGCVRRVCVGRHLPDGGVRHGARRCRRSRSPSARPPPPSAARSNRARSTSSRATPASRKQA